MRHFSLTDLDLFSAVADEQNLTRGAERVHLSAPSASLRLKKLGKTLGTTLLIRTQRGTELTPAGEIVNRSAKQVQWQLEAMMKALEPWVDRERGIIRIVANYGATVDFLPEDIADFMADHPATRVLNNERHRMWFRRLPKGVPTSVCRRTSAPTPMSPSFLIGKTISSS